MARRLIHVPIVHTPADLGSVADRLGAIGREQLSAEKWRKHQEQIAAFWESLKTELPERVEAELAGAGWEKVRIYQDGLPAGGEVARRIVEEVARKSSPNYEILNEFLRRGARLEQTEDPLLLQEEYGLIRRMAAAVSPQDQAQAQQAYRQRAAGLLEERDRFIARRIAETLQPTEVGLLFMGAHHRVVSHLPQDIGVIPLSWGTPLP